MRERTVAEGWEQQGRRKKDFFHLLFVGIFMNEASSHVESQ